MNTDGRRSGAAFDTLVLLALGLPVFFLGLGSYGLVNGDEGLYHAAARHMARTGELFALRFGGQPLYLDTFMDAPLQYWLRAGLIATFGDSYWTMRLLSATAGWLAVALCYRLGRSLASETGATGSGERAAGWMAALFQLTTYQFVYLHGARTGELDAIACLMVVAIALSFVRALKEERGFLGHHGLLIVLVGFKAPLLALPVLAELMTFALCREARPKLGAWLKLGLLLLPIGFAWHIAQAFAIGPRTLEVLSTMRGQAAGDDPSVVDAAHGPLGNADFYFDTWVFGVWPYAGLHVLGVAAVLFAGRAKTEEPAASGDGTLARRHALHAFLAVLLFYLPISKHNPWYLLPAYPFLNGLAACAILRACRSRPWAFGVVAATLAGAMVHAHFELNPFAQKANLVHFEPGFTLRGGQSLLFPALALLLVAWGRGRIAVRLMVGLAILGAAIRVGGALRHLGHRSDVERLRDDLVARIERGEPIDYPIPVPDGDDLRVWFLFYDHFLIVPSERSRREPFDLHPLEWSEPEIRAWDDF